MTIKELLERAIEQEQIDVQALIMFLVFEKQVHQMDDDIKVLDLYFLDRHHKRMTKELTEYKRKMNITYPPDLYEVETKTKSLYIYAYDMYQASAFAISLGYDVTNVKATTKIDEFYVNNIKLKTKELTKNKKVPSLIGKKGR